MRAVLPPDPCPYCSAEVLWKPESGFIYGGRDYGPVWVCSDHPRCDAYVGCHRREPRSPKGRLADPELRFWKRAAHGAFDPLWRRDRSSRDARSRGYAWMAKALELEPCDAHIGHFDVELCQRLIRICIPYLSRAQVRTLNLPRGWA